MADEETAYKYESPLESNDGAEVPAYDSALEGDVLHREYTTTSFVVVCAESKPHFHKDSVNVGVEEVPKGKYVETESEDE
jgi:hypothetical protein